VFNLSDPAVEEGLYDSVVLRQFAGIDLGAEPVPDETTICKFRHLLEEHITEDLRRMVGWLKSCGIDTAAMQSTAVYWLPVYEILKEQIFEPCKNLGISAN